MKCQGPLANVHVWQCSIWIKKYGKMGFLMQTSNVSAVYAGAGQPGWSNTALWLVNKTHAALWLVSKTYAELWLVSKLHSELPLAAMARPAGTHCRGSSWLESEGCQAGDSSTGIYWLMIRLRPRGVTEVESLDWGIVTEIWRNSLLIVVNLRNSQLYDTENSHWEMRDIGSQTLSNSLVEMREIVSKSNSHREMRELVSETMSTSLWDSG